MGKRKKISSFSIILAFVCLSLIGISLIPLLPIKLSPSQALPRISVQFSMRDSAPRTVELEATSKLEAMLNRIDGVKRISSKSGNGWGRVQIEFHHHKNIDVARFEVSSIIRQTWPLLPEKVSYPTISQSRLDNNANKPILTYTLHAPISPHEIQDFAEKSIKPQLAGIKGVTQIDTKGAMPMIWRLTYDVEVLMRHGITIQDIQRALSESLRHEFLDMTRVQLPSGEEEWLRLTLKPQEETEKDLLRHVDIKQVDGTIVPLGKVVQMERLEEEAQSYFRINGLNSIYLTITADEQSNQLALAKTLKEQMKQVREGLPSGYEIHLNYDDTEFIRDELDKIYFRAALTLTILLVFVLLTYRNLRYVLLIVVSLFSNLFIAAILYYLLNLEMQLYSLAGITISLTLIIDNTIVMTEHIVRRKNLAAFMPILAATLTTMGTLSVLFLMDEKTRMNLQDFVLVITVNLAVSLLVALFLVPALLDKLNIVRGKQGRRSNRIPYRKRWYWSVYFYRFYSVLCRFLHRWRVMVMIVLVLAFGIPVFSLPEKLEGDSKWAQFYNKTLGSTRYREDIAPYVNDILGGTLRLFVQKVQHGSYFKEREETNLYVTASLPSNSTISEMNGLVQQMEQYISQFSEIRQFQTDIHSARQAGIHIQFLKEHANGYFPHLLKSRLITKSLELGGGSWQVVGLGDGFSNDVREGAGSYRIEMFGYNYDELLHWAEGFKSELLTHRRIKDVIINAEFSWFKDDYEEFGFRLNRKRLAEENIQPYQLYEQLRLFLGNSIGVGDIPTPKGTEKVFLHAKQSDDFHIWDILHTPIHANDKQYKLSELAFIEKRQAPKEIGKVNQQYRLCLQYEYIGAHEQGKRVQDDYIKAYEEILPIGYTIKNANPSYRGKNEKEEYLLLVYIVAVMYVICCILFNSFKKPLYIIFVIPISFIGIFLSFYLFSVEFDQGGYASFILLAALTINANIYIVEEYGRVQRMAPIFADSMKIYLRAFRAKIRPILLTVLSTILGFIPFLIGEGKEAFWLPLAIGTIGGLVISTLSTILFLPLFMGVGKVNNHT